MTRHVAWVADEFLLERGFTITDPGPGRHRTASRGEMLFGLAPRCECEYCPEPNHPNYRCIAGAPS